MYTTAFHTTQDSPTTLTQQATPLFDTLLRRALDLIQRCECRGEKGCPGCIQYTACNQYNAVLHKQAAVLVLQETIAAEEAYREGRGGYVVPLGEEVAVVGRVVEMQEADNNNNNDNDGDDDDNAGDNEGNDMVE